MEQGTLSRREGYILTLVTYAVLIAVAFAGVSNAPDPAIRWPTLGLCLLFGLIMLKPPTPQVHGAWAHGYLAVQAALAATLMSIHPDWTLFALLFFVLSGQAALALTLLHSVLWIAAFVGISLVFGFLRWGWPGGIVAALIYGGGFAFFAVFARALIRADVARRESQELVARLQEAHTRLQDYALHAEELAVVQERNRLAREMHDTLGHRLTVAAVQLEAAQRICQQDPERAAGLVGTVRQQVREALAELRSTVATLRSPVEADLELSGSLRRLANSFEEATGLTVHRVLPDTLPELPATHRLALYRTAQEALTNVGKHAVANQVWMVLSANETEVALLVADDGQGICHGRNPAGFGLRGLRERASQLGGDLCLDPRPLGGTQLSMRLPLHRLDTGQPDAAALFLGSVGGRHA
jgi:signal transduction histidine kinase